MSMRLCYCVSFGLYIFVFFFSPHVPSRQLSRPTRSSPATPVPSASTSEQNFLIDFHSPENIFTRRPGRPACPISDMVDCIIPLIYTRLSPHPRRFPYDERYNRSIRFPASHDHTRQRTLLLQQDAFSHPSLLGGCRGFLRPTPFRALSTNARCFGRLPAAQLDSIGRLDGRLGDSGIFPLHPSPHRHGNEMTGGFGTVRSLAEASVDGRVFLNNARGGVF